MNSIHILLVEDNEGDIILTSEALEESDIPNKISIAKDGKLAIDFLNKEDQFENVESPDLILLDINLPKKNGHEVLEYIKSSETLKKIPVILLSTSSSKKDIQECYKHHANGYITKPFDVDVFKLAIAKIENFSAI